MQVRTRFAPSPTGYLHLGGLRTALYTYLFARREGGKFIRRMADPDHEREVPGAVEKIYASLAAAGLSSDAGPDVGGDYGPYIQTQRRDLYLPYAQELVRRGGAYYCFCTKERLDEARAQAEKEGKTFKYDKHCLHLSPEEIERRIAAGEPYVIRQNVPTEGKAGFDDLLYGHVEVDCSTLDDNVLIKADGLPTYNFANVVDDHLMGITHVVRGSEYLSSAPKYDLLYRGLGWEIPRYVHCSPVMRDAQNKMSKRHGDPSYEDLIAQGFLTQAVVNYVALLGWSPEGEREFFTIQELAEVFDLHRISRSPAIFDLEKLTYFNAAYIKAMAPEDFARAAEPWIRRAVKNPALDPALIAAILQPRTEKLSDIPDKLDFFDALPDYDTELYVHKKSKTDRAVSLDALERVTPRLRALPVWTEEAIGACMADLAQELGCKNARVMWPVRIAVSGRAVTPGGAVELCHILGREETLRRLEDGMARLRA